MTHIIRSLVCPIKRTSCRQLQYVTSSCIRSYRTACLKYRARNYHRSYSTDRALNSTDNDTQDDPPQPEHAVISTFDLFSIGGLAILLPIWSIFSD